MKVHHAALALFFGTSSVLEVSASPVQQHVRRQVEVAATQKEENNDDLVRSISARVDSLWETEGLAGLKEAVAVDSLSPNFNPDWATTGEYKQLLEYYVNYAKEKLGDKLEVTHKIYGGIDTPPLLSITIQGSEEDAEEDAMEVLLYSHADTMPHNGDDWDKSDPLVATRVQLGDSDKFYGRGTTDDKYAFFSSMIILQTLMDLDLPFPTVHVVIETEEESGSPHLDSYLDSLLEDIGEPDIVYVLDSGGPDQSHFWNSRTLRGLISGILRVELLDSSVHSGTAGGVVPSVFRLMNNLIEDRIEARDGTIIAPPLVHVPSELDRAAAYSLAEVMGDAVYAPLPWEPNSSPMEDASKTPSTQDIADMLIRNNYQSALAIIGWDHSVMPTIEKGGNAVQPYIEAKLSLRCSPYTDVDVAAGELKELIEAPPHAHGANVTFTVAGASPGFAAAPLPSWYRDIVDEAAVPIYGNKMLDAGKGGTIGFLNTIQKKLSKSIIHNAGLFDPAAKGHAPDESLDVNAVKKFTSVMAYTFQGIMDGAHHHAEQAPTRAEELVSVSMEEAAPQPEEESSAFAPTPAEELVSVSMEEGAAPQPEESSAFASVLAGHTILVALIASTLLLF